MRAPDPRQPLMVDEEIFKRMYSAVAKVEERMRRSSAALDEAGIPYAVVGGNAVAAWVASIDEGAARQTRDVDILVRREDLARIREVFEARGFVYRHVAAMDIFLDNADAKAADAVRLVFAGEKVQASNPVDTPDVAHVENLRGVRMLGLVELVTMKLTAWRRKDQVHVLDLIGVGLVDESWLPKLPEVLAARLKELLDNPDG